MKSKKYYVKKEGNLYVLRQTRFKNKKHPHDVCAYARSNAEMARMRKKYGLK